MMDGAGGERTGPGDTTASAAGFVAASRYELGGYASFSDDDDPDEVDAAFRSQRRLAVGHFAVFLVVTLGAGLTLLTLSWASDASIFGGFTPGFAIAAFGLYLFFVAVGAASTPLANAIEDKMMGARALDPDRA